MRIFVYLFLIFSILGCTRQEDVLQKSDTSFFVVDGTNSSMKMDTLYNPELNETNPGVFYAEFDLYPDNFGKVELKLGSDGYTKNIDGVPHMRKSIFAWVENTLVKNYDFYSVKSISSTSDSLANTAGESTFAPFTNAVSSYKKNSAICQWYEKGDLIKKDDENWLHYTDQNNALELGGGSSRYLYLHTNIRDTAPKNPNYNFTIKDYYFPFWSNANHKYLVFSWTDSIKNRTFYGWVELSITADAELKIHKIVYEVEA